MSDSGGAGPFAKSAVRLFGGAALLLNWRPREFWESTPAELSAALQWDCAIEGFDAAKVTELMRRFPDRKNQDGR